MHKTDTLLAHAGRHPERHAGTVNTPVYRTSTVIFPDLDSYESRKQQGDKSVRYGRHGTPTTFSFEEAVARLEGGHQSITLPNGLAAIVATLMGLVRPGSHLLMPDTVYAPARRFCVRRLIPWGVDVEFYDPLAGAGIERLLRPETAAVYCESPGSLTFEVQDIPAIAAAAKRHGIPVVADNTWATPYFFRPFDKGVDISIHAATKYIGGHSDVMLGVVTTNEAWWGPVRQSVDEYGFGASPDDCYLALRGLRTLGVRLERQMANACAVAAWLESRPEVARVVYPALPSHPQHALWRRDFSGAASLFSVELAPMEQARLRRFVDALRLFGIGSSWGGYESLINVVHTEGLRTATHGPAQGPIVRLHVGLEDASDLIADLAQGLAAAQPGAR